MRTAEKSSPKITTSVKTLTVETDADLNISSASEYFCYLLDANNAFPFACPFPEIFDVSDTKSIQEVFIDIAESYSPSTFLARLPISEGSIMLTQWIINPVFLFK